jgi:hypothetical protein
MEIVTGSMNNERSKVMKHKIVRIALVTLEAFVGLSAVVGGVAIMAGAIRFPVEWLQGTPFSDYTIPGFVLAIVVGGSSLVAAETILTGREVGMLASALAGLIMAGYEVVEVATIDHLNWLQVLYFVLGLLIFGLAAGLWMAEVRRQHVQAGGV